MINAILKLFNNPVLRENMGKMNIEESKKYSVDIVIERMSDIYKELI